MLHKQDLNELLNSGLTRLIISTSPLERGQFQKIYHSDEYENLLRGLNLLLRLNQHLDEPVNIEISFRSSMSKRQLLNLEDYVKYIKPYIKDKNRINVLLTGYDNWGGMISQSDLLGKMELAAKLNFKFRPCIRTFHASFGWDGAVMACGCRFTNYDNGNGLIIGDLNSSALKEIWQGSKIRMLRRSFINNNMPVVCSNCTMYNSV